MAKETLTYLSLEEFETELMQDPKFVEYRKAKQMEQTMLAQLKQARLKQKLSQSEIASRTGIKTQNISRLERGMVSPTFDTLARYAIALGATFKLELPTQTA